MDKHNLRARILFTQYSYLNFNKQCLRLGEPTEPDFQTERAKRNARVHHANAIVRSPINNNT